MQQHLRDKGDHALTGVHTAKGSLGQPMRLLESHLGA